MTGKRPAHNPILARSACANIASLCESVRVPFHVLATDNATERSTGCWRIRSCSVCGFNTWSILTSAVTLCNSPIV